MTLILTAYMASPCHIELILSEKEEPVKKEVSAILVIKPPFGKFINWSNFYFNHIPLDEQILFTYPPPCFYYL